MAPSSPGASPHLPRATRQDAGQDDLDREHARRTGEAREFVRAVYQSFFGRDPEADVHVAPLASGERSYAEFIRGLVEADEFKMHWSRRRP